jgi:hypothetical protein
LILEANNVVDGNVGNPNELWDDVMAFCREEGTISPAAVHVVERSSVYS